MRLLNLLFVRISTWRDCVTRFCFVLTLIVHRNSRLRETFSEHLFSFWRRLANYYFLSYWFNDFSGDLLKDVWLKATCNFWQVVPLIQFLTFNYEGCRRLARHWLTPGLTRGFHAVTWHCSTQEKNLTGTFTPIKYKQNKGKLRDNAFMNWVTKMRQSVKTKR